MTLTEHIQPLLDKRLTVALAVVMLTGVSPSSAQDHLRPEGNPYDPAAAGYYELVGTAMHEAFDDNVRVRVLSDSMFAPQAAFGVKEDHGKYKLFGLVARERMRDKPVPVKRCEAAIDAPLALRVVQVWKSSLLAARYRQPGEETVVNSDGTEFHFSMRDGGQELAGQAWGLDSKASDVIPNTNTAALIGIVATMFNACLAYDATLKWLLDQQVSQLQARLDVEKQK